ncbi:DMT family transporter [Roseobacter ponti]|uniref:DMT family transporter n=1 Tax=Roseobacter ponti TaxID=1891787 RepID=A0A858SZE6_9RHOB|nr:DMT family transporter [Roseobacter ponti]QJF53252.1 DMT family transporter [Roseobacter ponti]
MFTPRAENPRIAVLLMLIATAFIAATMLFAKVLGSDAAGPALHPLQITHGRFVFAFAVLAAAAGVLRPTLTRPGWWLHIARTTCGWAGVTLMFASVAYIPLADATAITFLNPVFGMMLAIPLLGEKVGRIRWSAAAMALAGAVILLRPTPESFQAASLLALAAAAVMGLELIFIKKLSGREPAFQVLLTNNFLGLILACAAVVFVWQAPTGLQWLLLGGLGLCMAAAQACFVNAMARADASFVAPFSYGTLIFATLYDVAFYNQIPDMVTWLGAGIILTGGIILAVREARARTAAVQSAPPVVQRL